MVMPSTNIDDKWAKISILVAIKGLIGILFTKVTASGKILSSRGDNVSCNTFFKSTHSWFQGAHSWFQGAHSWSEGTHSWSKSTPSVHKSTP
jgi:hypothetical protein